MTNQELATVLAALRYWQQDLEANDAPPISEEFFADCAPLTTEEIDELCERLNSEPETLEPSRQVKARTRAEGWAARSSSAAATVTLVMEVLPCRGSEDGYPEWAEIKVDPQLLEVLKHLHTVCRREGLGSVSVDMALERWAEMDGFSVYREHLAVTQREFCFAARRDCDGVYADYDVETLDITIREFLAVIERKDKLPEGWARKGEILFVATTKDNLRYLRQNYAESNRARRTRKRNP